jgi:hypothetical protein
MGNRTPAQIGKFLEAKRHRMDSPEQTYGDEPNSYRKDWDTAVTRTCIFACWAYEQAAGNQAIPMVYQSVNEAEGNELGSKPHLCDRSYFFSTPRDLRLSANEGIPVFGIESKHQLRDFDVIGTSISYPVLSINLVKQLVMSDIPPTWEDRSDSAGKTYAGRNRNPEAWPMVMCGGQSYGAPEVVANVVDVWWCGEVEDEEGNPGIGAMLNRIDAFKKSGRWMSNRMSCYRDLAKEFSFLYFPNLFDVHYAYENRPSVATSREMLTMPGEVRPSKQVIGITSQVAGAQMPVVKRFVKNLDGIRGLDNPPLLYIDPGMGAGDAEVSRGCPAWCSFCALTYRQKPYRQRSVAKMRDFSTKLLQNTGGTHVSPFGPDFPMHTQKMALISDQLEHVTDDIDASSMRVDDFIADPRYILLQAHGGMESVTLGVEGNSQRMRDLIGKGAADEDVREAVGRGIAAGIRKFKLYMIASLPGEDEGDIFRIMSLAKDLADIRDGMGSSAKIQFSWTPLLVEANTPMQWFAPTAANYALGDVWEEFRDLKIEFKLGGKAQKDKVAYFQLSQRASREVGMAMIETVAEMNAGCWGGAPRGMFEVMQAALTRHGFLNQFADCYDERTKQDMFGWEVVDQGINVELMWVTYQQMKEFLENTDSETYDENFGDDYHGSEWVERCDTKCSGKTCGVCDVEDLKIRRNYIVGAANEAQIDLAAVKIIDQKTVAMRVRCRFETTDYKRFVGTKHWKHAMRRAAFRVGMPITKRAINFSSDALKFRDWTSGADFVEFGLTRRVGKAELGELIEKMNTELGADIQITDWTMRPALGAPLRSDVDLSFFEMELDTDVYTAQAAIDRWNASEYVAMIIREDTYAQGMLRETVNGKDLVDDLWLSRSGPRLMVRMLVRGKATPYLVYASMFGKNSWIEAAGNPARRIEAFVEREDERIDSFTPDCISCLMPIPVNMLEKPFGLEYCPRCKDEADGVTTQPARVHT